GIEFGVNWSWLVVFALIVWTLASGIFPSTNPGLSKATHIAMAVVAAFLFFLSLLLHEFGHALRARREGIEIDGIPLWLFGGVARFKGSFRSAGAEFRVAIAGPLVSLALGVLFVLIALIPGIPSAVDGVAAWLGYINLTLLVFNLIPAPPLDGGRVLHAALWRWRGAHGWATRTAADVGPRFRHLLLPRRIPALLERALACGPRLVPAQRGSGRGALPPRSAGPERAKRARRDDAEPRRGRPRHEARRVHGQDRALAAPHDVSGRRERQARGSP